MSGVPTGRLFPGGGLEFVRVFRAPVEDVWASVTESERTARWFGPWEGEAGVGRVIKVRMAFEESEPWCSVRIDACEPPVRLGLSMKDEFGDWRVEVLLSEVGGRTELRFVSHMEGVDGIGEVGPGWEYYLDKLVAARDGSPSPVFSAYYPAMKPYFESLV